MIRHYVRARLHRRLFVWFGFAILFTGVTVMLVMGAVGGGPSYRRELDGARGFVAERFAGAWGDAAAEGVLLQSLEHHFDVKAFLTDRSHLPRAGAERPEMCSRPSFVAPVVKGGELVGHVELCPVQHGRVLWRLVLALGTAGFVLWAASGKIARRLTRPLGELARVAGEIGAGKLGSRARIGRHQPGEVGMLAEAVNDMAARIERQLVDQRELLAAVSHEIRTPLARLRLLTEIARDASSAPGSGKSGLSAKVCDDIDREVLEIDALVGELLASSRVDFGTLTPRSLDAVEVARQALERAGIGGDPEIGRADGATDGSPIVVEADPTLLARALANLVDNARRHGGGLSALRVEARGDRVAFEALDAGPGIAQGERERIFEPFVRGGTEERGGSLGLGLSLVLRIAKAHGGRAYADNRAEGGARIGIELPAVARAGK